MIKFEFEATINSNLEQAFTNLDIENIDVLDEDEDGVIVWGIVHNEKDLASFKEFFIPHKDMIQSIMIEHEFEHLFNDFETSPIDEDQFNVAIENNFDLTKALTILE